jgi:hypothetical protein
MAAGTWGGSMLETAQRSICNGYHTLFRATVKPSLAREFTPRPDTSERDGGVRRAFRRCAGEAGVKWSKSHRARVRLAKSELDEHDVDVAAVAGASRGDRKWAPDSESTEMAQWRMLTPIEPRDVA